jgi:hypothetical protein
LQSRVFTPWMLVIIVRARARTININL